MIKIPKRLQSYEVYIPGKPLEEAQRELGVERVTKLASNENPIGTSPLALQAIRKWMDRVRLYPDSGSYYLSQKLSARLGVDAENILVGPGSAVIAKWIARALLEEDDRVITSDKTFLIYKIAVQEIPAELLKVPARDYGYDLEGILSKVDSRTRIIFIANPNNPTGTHIEEGEFRAFMERVPDDVLVVYDEAYREYVESPAHPKGEKLLRDFPNLVVLRTFSKIYGLAGMRVGYALFGQREVKEAVWKVVPPFPVSLLAQKAAEAALDDLEFVKRSHEVNLKGKEYLYRELERLGLRYIPTQANFVFVIPPGDAREVVRGLFQRGIIVRHTRAFDAPEGFRVTVGTEEENKAFVKTLEEVLAH